MKEIILKNMERMHKAVETFMEDSFTAMEKLYENNLNMISSELNALSCDIKITLRNLLL